MSGMVCYSGVTRSLNEWNGLLFRGKQGVLLLLF